MHVMHLYIFKELMKNKFTLKLPHWERIQIFHYIKFYVSSCTFAPLQPVIISISNGYSSVLLLLISWPVVFPDLRISDWTCQVTYSDLHSVLWAQSCHPCQRYRSQ